MKVYVVVTAGCGDCGTDTTVVGVFADAEAAADAAKNCYRRCHTGDSPEVIESELSVAP